MSGVNIVTGPQSHTLSYPVVPVLRLPALLPPRVGLTLIF